MNFYDIQYCAVLRIKLRTSPRDRKLMKVDKKMLGRVLGKIGLSAKMINIVHNMYVDTRAKKQTRRHRNKLGEK